MKIQIIGTGCPKCKLLEAKAREAVSELDEIMNMGVMMTPALAIDDDVKSAGKVLNKEQVMEKIREVM